MKGVLIALLGAWLSGLAIPGIKLFLEDISPFNLIFISNIGAIVIIFLAKPVMAPGFKWPQPQEYKWLALAFLLGSIIAVPAAIVGMVTVSGSVSGQLFNLEMFFTFYLAYFLFKEKLSARSQVAMWLVFIGGITSALGGPLAGDVKGMTLIVISCLFFSIQTNILKKVQSLDSFTLAGTEFFVTCVVAFIWGRLLNQELPAWGSVGQLLFLGVLTYAFGNVLFYKSLKRIGAGRTATIFGSAPLLGTLSSFVILNDPVTPTVVAGIAFVGVGLLVLATEKRESSG